MDPSTRMGPASGGVQRRAPQKMTLGHEELQELHDKYMCGTETADVKQWGRVKDGKDGVPGAAAGGRGQGTSDEIAISKRL